MSTRERNRRGEGARLRTDIVAAAAGLLDEAGNEQAVTLRAVARRIGIAAPSIYAHFADRQTILLAVVQDAFAELAEALRATENAGALRATDNAAALRATDNAAALRATDNAAALRATDNAGALRAKEDTAVLRATEIAGALAEARLRAACTAYLEFAATRPQRYRVMFGGLWNGGQAVADSAAVSAADVTGLGQEALAVLITALDACVAAGVSASTDTAADAVALWLGLHGLAHQRAVIPGFPWPADITERLITSLAHLTSTSRGASPSTSS